jgi:hypothetical protein
MLQNYIGFLNKIAMFGGGDGSFGNLWEEVSENNKRQLSELFEPHLQLSSKFTHDEVSVVLRNVGPGVAQFGPHPLLKNGVEMANGKIFGDDTTTKTEMCCKTVAEHVPKNEVLGNGEKITLFSCKPCVGAQSDWFLEMKKHLKGNYIFQYRSTLGNFKHQTFEKNIEEAPSFTQK